MQLSSGLYRSIFEETGNTERSFWVTFSIYHQTSPTVQYHLSYRYRGCSKAHMSAFRSRLISWTAVSILPFKGSLSGCLLYTWQVTNKWFPRLNWIHNKGAQRVELQRNVHQQHSANSRQSPSWELLVMWPRSQPCWNNISSWTLWKSSSPSESSLFELKFWLSQTIPWVSV